MCITCWLPRARRASSSTSKGVCGRGKVKCLGRNIYNTDSAKQKIPYNEFFFVLLLSVFVSSWTWWKDHSEPRKPPCTKHGRCRNTDQICAAVSPKPSMWHSKNVQVLTVQFMSLLLCVPQTGNFSIIAREGEESFFLILYYSLCHCNGGSAVVHIVPV